MLACLDGWRVWVVGVGVVGVCGWLACVGGWRVWVVGVWVLALIPDLA